MSPKSHLRGAKKKRKAGHKLRLGLLVSGLLFLLGIVGVALYFLFQGTPVVSPLQGAVGQTLGISAPDTGVETLKRLLTTHAISYTSVVSGSDEYIVSLNSKQQVILSKHKDLAQQISSLQVVLPSLTMEGKQFSRLDLRYDKPVVIY